MVTVLVDVAEGDIPNGALLALGCALGGWSFHLLGGRLRYVHNLYGRSRDTVETDQVVGSGRHTLSFAFEANEKGGGNVVLAIDEREVATGAIERFTPAVFNEVGIGMTCGYEWGPAVGEGYSAPFTFNGKIVRAELTPTGPVLLDLVLEFASILARQ
jgi:hypothetical protein